MENEARRELTKFREATQALVVSFCLSPMVPPPLEETMAFRVMPAAESDSFALPAVFSLGAFFFMDPSREREH